MHNPPENFRRSLHALVGRTIRVRIENPERPGNALGVVGELLKAGPRIVINDYHRPIDYTEVEAIEIQGPYIG